MTIQLPNSKTLDTLSVSELQKSLSTSDAGLTNKEAVDRLAQFGGNALAEKKESTLMKLLKFF